jgi:hypothetical protein
MSILLYPPEIIDLQTEQVVFKVKDHAWSVGSSEWESNSVVRMDLCNYPHIPPGGALIVKINCTNKTAKIGNNEEIELQALGGALQKARVSSPA